MSIVFVLRLIFVLYTLFIHRDNTPKRTHPRNPSRPGSEYTQSTGLSERDGTQVVSVEVDEAKVVEEKSRTGQKIKGKRVQTRWTQYEIGGRVVGLIVSSIETQFQTRIRYIGTRLSNGTDLASQDNTSHPCYVTDEVSRKHSLFDEP